MLKYAQLIILSLFLAGCQSFQVFARVDQTPIISSQHYIDILIPGAISEGELNILVKTPGSIDYKILSEGFFKKYKIRVNYIYFPKNITDVFLSPDAELPISSLDIVESDMLDIYHTAQTGFLQPNILANWTNIPQNLRDDNGYWYGIYFGVIAFRVNEEFIEKIPLDWSALFDQKYKLNIGIGDDDPSSNLLQTAIAAAAYSNGGSIDDPLSGVKYFSRLLEEGKLIPPSEMVQYNPDTRPSIVIDWDYSALQEKQDMRNIQKITVVIPQNRSVLGVRAQGMRIDAPHPYSAKLWLEYITSDEGQLLILNSYAHPIRYNPLIKRGIITPDKLLLFPPADHYARVVTPTLDQILVLDKVLSGNLLSSDTDSFLNEK